jgi:hypothetical protein
MNSPVRRQLKPKCKDYEMDRVDRIPLYPDQQNTLCWGEVCSDVLERSCKRYVPRTQWRRPIPTFRLHYGRQT